MNFKTYSTLYQYTFKWTFDDISKLPKNWEEHTPEFIVEPQSKWHIKLKKDETNSYWMYLHWNTKIRFQNSYEALVLNSNQQVVARYKGSLATNSKEILPSGFYGDVIRKLSDGQISFEISLQVWFINSTTLQIPKVPDLQDHLMKLQGDLKYIYTNNIKSDVTLHVDGGTLPAHKALLMARSEVFARMFQPGLKEDETGTVDIEDIKLDTMRTLLMFVYSAEVTDLDLDSAMEVYAAADKYAIMDLKDVCRRLIASKITVDSATKVLVFAEARGDSSLGDSVMEYIALSYSAKNEVKP